jgi:hypothetical protein
MPEKADFIQIANIIFKDRSKYKVLSDQDKIDAFYKINQKCSVKFLKQAEFFNHKFIDRASAIDVWYKYFEGSNGTPGWWFAKSNKEKEAKVKKVPSADKQDLQNRYELKDNDYNFLEKYFKEDIELEIKKNKKYV